MEKASIDAVPDCVRHNFLMPDTDDQLELAQARTHEELVIQARASGDEAMAVDHLSRVIAFHRFTGDRTSLLDSQLLLAELDREDRTSWAQGALALAQRIGSADGRQRASRLLGRSVGDFPVS